MKPLPYRSLACAGLLVGCAGLAQAQSIYGEIGYAEITTRISVPLIGLSASAKPSMVRALIGVSPLGGLSVEALAAGQLTDARFTASTQGGLAGRAKVSDIFGLYIGSRLGLGPVELYGRAGWAQSAVAFSNLGAGTGTDRDFSYGGGLRLIPGKSFTLSADYMNFLNRGGARVEGYTFSIGYRF